jgi:NADH dehydrogenase FAD-containing subunit
MGRLLLAGAGHAHLTTIKSIREIIARGHDVIAVGPSETHYYSGMGPGVLGGAYRPEEAGFPVRAMVENQGGTFIVGKAASINAARRMVMLESGREVPYDVLSCNLGSKVPLDMINGDPSDIFPVKPIENLFAARKRIIDLAARKVVRVGICGGGLAAIETAGNAFHAGSEQGGHGCKVQLFMRGTLLGSMPAKVRRLTENSLKNRGIEIFTNTPVKYVEKGLIHVKNGTAFPQDIILLAPGIKPPDIFARSGLKTGKDGGLLVNRYLQSPDHPEIFGGGDCIWFEPHPLQKSGVYAMRQNPVLYHNLVGQLEGTGLQAFDPGGDNYLVIANIGGGYGIFSKMGLIFDGKAGFIIKDRIDRRFIRRFND